MIYILQDFWAYDLSGNKMTKRDVKKAHDYNLTVRYAGDEFYIIGSWTSIFNYLHDYIGVEIVNEYLYHLKDVI